MGLDRGRRTGYGSVKLTEGQVQGTIIERRNVESSLGQLLRTIEVASLVLEQLVLRSGQSSSRTGGSLRRYVHLH